MNSLYKNFYSNQKLRSILYLLEVPLILISLIIPKKKGLTLFGSRYGYQVSDNSKYKFINEYKKDYYFITKNKEILKKRYFLEFSQFIQIVLKVLIYN